MSESLVTLSRCLSFIRRLAHDALPPEYIIDQPDLTSAKAEAIAEQAEAIRAGAKEIMAQREGRKDN